MANEEIEIEIIHGDISFCRYRNKAKNDILLEILKDIFSKKEMEHVERWIRAGETMIDPFGSVDSEIYCG